MNCPHCNEQIPDEALFCPHCGKAVSDIKADETATAGYRENRSGYYEPVQINPPENRQVPPAYNVQSQYTRSQNPYKQTPPISPEKPKNPAAPIIIALLTCIAAIGLVFVIVFRPGPFNRTSDPDNHSESGSADYGKQSLRERKCRLR